MTSVASEPRVSRPKFPVAVGVARQRYLRQCAPEPLHSTGYASRSVRPFRAEVLQAWEVRLEAFVPVIARPDAERRWVHGWPDCLKAGRVRDKPGSSRCSTLKLPPR